jgi:hypothetical protein
MTKAYTSPVGNSPKEVHQLRRLIGETRGGFFSVLFVPRGGKVLRKRKMRARLKVVSPETRAVDLWTHNVTVWDIEKRAWRRVPLERVVRFKGAGREWLTSVGD